MDRYTQGTLITANARLSRQLRRDYDDQRRRQGVRVWETADILPRSAWLARAWEECAYRDPFHTPVLLSPLQEEALWEQAIKTSDGASILLDLSATVTAAAQAWGLVRAWEAPCNVAEFRGLQDPEEFLEWMLAVERKLHDNDWITASQLPRALLDRIASGTLAPAPLFHAGFDELTPADRRLFEACHAQPWPAEPAHLAPVRHRVGLRDSSEELIQAAAWARRKLEAQPDARIGIVVRGLAGLSAAAERIFDDTFHPALDFARPGSGLAFHISAGVPSADVPLIATALLALGIHPGLQIGEAGMLLRSPFLRFDQWHGARLFADLRRQGVDKVSFEVDAVRRMFPDMAKAAEESRPRQHPSEWSATFSKLLRHAGWPGERPTLPRRASDRRALEKPSLRTRLARRRAPPPHLRPSAPTSARHRPRSTLRPPRRRRARSNHGHARSRRIAIRCLVDRRPARRRVARRRAPQSFSAFVAPAPGRNAAQFAGA